MKLATIDGDGGGRLGVKWDEGVLDIRAALGALPDPEVPADVMALLEGGATALDALEGYLRRLKKFGEDARFLLQEEEVIFGPCVTRPNKIVCVGLNYRKHAAETNAAIPAFPILFNKFNNALTGHRKDVPLPERVSSEVDYEAELAIVIGKTAKYVEKENALDHVFGYCCANDLSARDLQMRTPQWLLGKSCDGFSPLGPYLVTADEIVDPNDLEIRCAVNGEVRQRSRTSDMIFGCDEIVSYVSRHMTLVPGDVILTGTPEGVVLGYPKERRVYLRAGDFVSVEIEKLGRLTNRMIGE